MIAAVHNVDAYGLTTIEEKLIVPKKLAAWARIDHPEYGTFDVDVGITGDGKDISFDQFFLDNKVYLRPLIFTRK